MAKAAKTSSEKRTASVSVRVKPSLHKALRAAAAEDGRTLAQYVERVMEMHLKELKKLD